MFGVECPRNELVIRLQPKEEIYIKTNVKTPGFSSAPIQSELAVEYISHFGRNLRTPDAYSRLILDVLRGRSAGFVRSDELEEVREREKERERELRVAKASGQPRGQGVVALHVVALLTPINAPHPSLNHRCSHGESSPPSYTTSSRPLPSPRCTHRGRGGRRTTRRWRSGGTGGTRSTCTLTGRLC